MSPIRDLIKDLNDLVDVTPHQRDVINEAANVLGNFEASGLRDVLRSLQNMEMSVARAEELVEYWLVGKLTDDMLPERDPDRLTIMDYEEAEEDRQALIRQLDVTWNGEAGAAKKASLRDIVSQIVRDMKNHHMVLEHAGWMYEIDGMVHDADHPPTLTTKRWSAAMDEMFTETELFTKAKASAAQWDLANPRAETAGPWVCFHCNEVFHTPETARVHFGKSERQEPSCQIDVEKYREMEQAVTRAADDDSDTDRRMYAQQSQHQVNLRREEEKGYAQALKDCRTILLSDSVLTKAAKEVEASATVWTGFAMLDAKTCISAALNQTIGLTPYVDPDGERYRWLFSGHSEEELIAAALANRQPEPHETPQMAVIGEIAMVYVSKESVDKVIDRVRAGLETKS